MKEREWEGREEGKRTDNSLGWIQFWVQVGLFSCFASWSDLLFLKSHYFELHLHLALSTRERERRCRASKHEMHAQAYASSHCELSVFCSCLLKDRPPTLDPLLFKEVESLCPYIELSKAAFRRCLFTIWHTVEVHINCTYDGWRGRGR